MAKTLCTGLNALYIKDWGVVEGIRDTVQNALDGMDGGASLEIYRTPGPSGVVHIRNEGVTLPESAWLMGTTTKANGRSRGRHGGGLKESALALVRAGCTVTVASGDKIYEPFIGPAADFGGADALMLSVRQRGNNKVENEVDVRIKGISQASWDSIMKERFLAPMVPGGRAHRALVCLIPETVQQSRLLLDEELRGRLYIGGIYVARLPGVYAHGFDFCPTLLKIDRDRNMVDPASLTDAITKLLRTLVETNQLDKHRLYTLASSECGEADALRSEYAWSSRQDAVTEAMTAVHVETHGADAFAVSGGDSYLIADGAAVGVKVVAVSSAVAALVNQTIGSAYRAVKTKASGVKATHSLTDLSAAELGVLTYARRALDAAGYKMYPNTCGYSSGTTDETDPVMPVEVVDFFSADRFGEYGDGVIRLARVSLTSQKQALTTLVHEVAHKTGGGGDATMTHQRALEKVWGDVFFAATSSLT